MGKKLDAMVRVTKAEAKLAAAEEAKYEAARVAMFAPDGRSAMARLDYQKAAIAVLRAKGALRKAQAAAAALA